MTDNDTLHRLAARQHGLAGRAQLSELGFSRQAVHRAVRSGRLERLSARVLKVAGSPDTPHQRMMLAVLDTPGAVVARQSAAWMWGIPGFELEPIHVLTSRMPHRDAGRAGPMHSTVLITDGHRTSIRGVPVTTPARTLLDLAARVHPIRLEQACERMVSGRLLRLEDLHRLAAEVEASRRLSGRRAFLDLVRARPVGARPAESNLELRFERILHDAGEPPFERQVDLGDADGWIGRVDHLDRATKVVVEVQGEVVHAGVEASVRDAARHARLRAAGWTVVAVSERDIWHHPDRVVRAVRRARGSTIGAARGRSGPREAA